MVFGLDIVIQMRGKGGLIVTIYYCITIIVNIVAVIVFYKNINVTGLSVMPLFLIALMIFQAHILKMKK